MRDATVAPVRFDDRVVIITGAGRGLGRIYALEIARRGGKVIVNDLGTAEDGSRAAAESVVGEIIDAGGQAVTDFNSVASPKGARALVAAAAKTFDKVDAVINNAGIVRDASILKLTHEDIDAVLDVHLRGSFYVSQAAFALMKNQGYGRLVFTTSAAGLFGNFGQANYAAAKLGVVGLSNVFSIEGAKYNIKANVIAPAAKTRMTESMGPLVEAMAPECVAPMVAYLASEQCQETRNIYSANAGRFCRIFIAETAGWSGQSAQPSVEELAANMDQVNAEDGYYVPKFAGDVKRVPIDYERSMALRTSASAAYSERDLMLYALGLGLGSDPLDRREIDFVYERRLKPFPTYLVNTGFAGNKVLLGIGLNAMMALHGEQKIEMFGTMPPKAELDVDARVGNIFDKGVSKGAVVLVETDIRLKGSPDLLCRLTATYFARGDGGFLKPGQTVRGEQPVPHSVPDRAPDMTVTYPTRPDQALLFRLSGDYNPLHADPEFAAKAGFKQPILHGLCTYGICCRAVVAAMCEDDPSRIACFQARFSTPVIPGETIIVDLWRDGGTISFRAKIKERDVLAVNNGKAVLRKSSG